jgi:hypothetical protein
LENEKHGTYLLMWFLCYHFTFHLHLLSWNQHHSLNHFIAHRRLVNIAEVVSTNIQRQNVFVGKANNSGNLKKIEHRSVGAGGG